MAGAKSRRERERLEQQPGDDQMQRAAMVGRGTQPLDWYSRAENKTKARRKPTSFSVPCSLQLARQRQELNSRPVFSGNKLRSCWPPSETDGKAGKGACSWKKPLLSWQSHQAAGNKVDRMVIVGQERKTATEAAVKEGSFLPGVTYPEKREQVCSWAKSREQRDDEKSLAPGDGDVGSGKRGGQVSQRVSAFQQGKLQLKRGSASASSPVLLEPAKPLPHGLLSFRQAASQCTKPTKWVFLGDRRSCALPTAELPEKENEVCGSFSPSTPTEGDARPAVTDDKPEWTTSTAGDKHHLGEGVNNPQPAHVPEGLETRNNTNMKQKYRDEGTDPPEPKAKHQAPHIPVVPGTPSAAPTSPEPRGLSGSPEIAELVSETSKIDADELPRKQTTVILEDNVQPSSVSHLPGEESTGAGFEKTNETKEVNPSGFPEEPSPDHTSQGNKAEKNSISTLALPEMTDDHHMSHLQETEPQATYGQLVTNPHSDKLAHGVTDVLGKGFTFGKKPLTALFGSEDKGSSHKKETTQRKPTKPQSALVTLFGRSSEKKQSKQKNPAVSSEQTNNEDKQEKLQGLLSSSSRAKQKASKNDQPPQPEKTVVIPEDTQESAGGCSDTTEGKETDVLLWAPGTSFSGDDEHQRTELNVHDQPTVGRQDQQPQDRCCPSLLPAQENQKEDAISFEGGRNPFYPPPEVTSAVDDSKKILTGDGNPHVGHPLDQNLLSLDVQNIMIEDEIFSSSSNLGKLPKEAELQLDNMDLLEGDNLFLSVENKRQDFPTTVTPALDLQNPQTGTPPCFDPNPSKLDREVLAETNVPLVAWDTSSLLFLAGQDEIVTRDPEGSQSCAPLQHFDPQYQAPIAAEGAFGLGPGAEGPTNKYLPMQEGSISPWYLFTSHASDNSHQNLFDPLSDVSDQTGQDAPAKMERSREISEAEEAHENLSSADPNVFIDGLLKQEFFI